MKSADIRLDLANRLHHWRARLIWQRALHYAAFAALLFALFRLLGYPGQHFSWLHFSWLHFSGLLAVFAALAFIALFYSKKWRALTPDNFVLHLNRRFPDFEESAQLLLSDENSLGVLQRLQQQRCLAVYADRLSKVQIWQPPVRYQKVVLLILLAVLIALGAHQIRDFTAQFQAQRLQTSSPSQPAAINTGLDDITISIRPPAYTRLDDTSFSTMDLEAFEGSQIEWTLAISGEADRYAIEFSDGIQLPMQLESGKWQASTVAATTDLYKVVAFSGNQSAYFGDIYALTVHLDQAPDIKIIEPATTTLEIPRNGPAVFNSEVMVKDDFGITAVNITASVAKGSGEGVKFRDETLEFDQSTEMDKGRLYERHWDLNALGMEPGDEIYFSINASDNKQPIPNTARSTTLIIRWLEDEQTGLAAEGLAIDFIPEFFKSQRQIIIDTEQLIKDQPDLDQQVFKDTSYLTGQAQADLKQKYGQYLGDEFGTGPGEQLGPGAGASGTGHANGHDGGEQDGGERDGGGHGDREAKEPTNPADIHAHVESGVTLNNATNINDIVKLFGHDHGEPEIGKVSKQSPIALMKRAVSEMWSAEKHLMQAEPALALPFEYEAYKYLKLARQADRIYVKRLGFEPPPVSEENRLTGELKDIRSYTLEQQADPDNLNTQRAGQRLLRQVWQLISTRLPADTIDAAEDEVLATMSLQYKALSQQRPALIKQAASIEKLRASKHWSVPGCDGCMQALKQSIWNLLDDGEAMLRFALPIYDSSDEMIRAYQLELQHLSDVEPLPTTTDGKQP